jgi:hypothetical protein
MEDEYSDHINHLPPISRGLRGSLAYHDSIDCYEDDTSIRRTSVSLESRGNRSSRENRLQLDCFVFYKAILAFKASRFDYTPYLSALRNTVGAVLNAPSRCPDAGVLCT